MAHSGLTDFRLDHAGCAEVLKTPEMRDMVNAAAVQVAANTRAHMPDRGEVQMRPYTTDRRAARVSIRQPGMSRDEADQVLYRAARALGPGVDVVERGQ